MHLSSKDKPWGKPFTFKRYIHPPLAEERIFYYFANFLNKQKQMKQIIDGQLKYATSNEYYMVERFCDHDGFYAPWSPNSSAMGRLIEMCFDFYGKEKL